jgi:hypothetical protein
MVGYLLYGINHGSQSSRTESRQDSWSKCFFRQGVSQRSRRRALQHHDERGGWGASTRLGLKEAVV